MRKLTIFAKYQKKKPNKISTLHWLRSSGDLVLVRQRSLCAFLNVCSLIYKIQGGQLDLRVTYRHKEQSLSSGIMTLPPLAIYPSILGTQGEAWGTHVSLLFHTYSVSTNICFEFSRTNLMCISVITGVPAWQVTLLSQLLIPLWFCIPTILSSFPFLFAESVFCASVIPVPLWTKSHTSLISSLSSKSLPRTMLTLQPLRVRLFFSYSLCIPGPAWKRAKCSPWTSLPPKDLSPLSPANSTSFESPIRLYHTINTLHCFCCGWRGSLSDFLEILAPDLLLVSLLFLSF